MMIKKCDFFRTGVENLKDLSCTDVRQQWGQCRKEAVSSITEGTPLDNLCHCKQISFDDINLSEDLQKNLFSLWVESK